MGARAHVEFILSSADRDTSGKYLVDEQNYQLQEDTPQQGLDTYVGEDVNYGGSGEETWLQDNEIPFINHNRACLGEYHEALGCYDGVADNMISVYALEGWPVTQYDMNGEPREGELAHLQKFVAARAHTLAVMPKRNTV